MLLSLIFAIWFCLISLLTFAIWLRPRLFFGAGELPAWYGAVSGAAAAVFFMTCFGLGVWISVARMRGAVWLP